MKLSEYLEKTIIDTSNCANFNGGCGSSLSIKYNQNECKEDAFELKFTDRDFKEKVLAYISREDIESIIKEFTDYLYFLDLEIK